MSTDENTHYSPIDGGSLFRFHSAKGVISHACDRCGTLAWAIMNDDASAPTAALPSALDQTKANVDLFLPLIVMTCMNCGNVWLTNRQLYDYWLKNGNEPLPPEGIR